MAMQPDIQYISYYMDGTAAKKMEQQVMRKVQAPKPKSRKVRRRVVKVDPVALASILLAVVMFACLTVGFSYYQGCLDKNAQMGQYIEALQQENVQLQKTYDEGYDLEEIRQIAQAIGMVPRDCVENIRIDVQVPITQEQEMSFWEAATTFLASLFA